MAIRVALAIILLATAGCFTQSNLPSQVTAASIRGLQLDMSRANVEEILGAPVGVELRDPEYFGSGGETLVYFHRPAVLLHYPMLWVHLSKGKVVEVYAKRHNTVNSDGVYGLDADGRWESPRFAQTFP